MKFYIAVPTYNGSSLWEKTVKEIKKACSEGYICKSD